MADFASPRSVSPSWRDNPTTADLVRETNKNIVELAGIPAAMQPWDVAAVLTKMKLPLRPLTPEQGWADGTEREEVFTQDGELFATFERTGFGHCRLKFSEFAQAEMRRGAQVAS